VTSLVDRMRAAGTHMRALALSGGVLSDPVTMSSDDGTPFTFLGGLSLADTVPISSDAAWSASAVLELPADAVTPATDAVDTMILSYTTRHNGQRLRNGAAPHASGAPLSGVMEGPP